MARVRVAAKKSILRAAVSVTEAYMRPLYHKKADRLRAKADRLEKEGLAKLQALKERPAEYDLFRRAVAHIIMGLGGENEQDTTKRLDDHGPISDETLLQALTTVLRQDAFNHRDLQVRGWPAGQRHERHVHGRQHRLQHGVWFDPALESASLPMDEFVVPGWRHH